MNIIVIVVFDSVQQALWDANVKHIRIDGSVPSSERNLLVKQFQSDPKTKVAILSILAAGSVGTLFMSLSFHMVTLTPRQQGVQIPAN